MTTIEWDKPKDRRYEIGIDRGVLYPNGSAGVPWNGLVSVDEDASGADVEPLYIDGYKYFDAVANEDFQATLSAFTYPKEFEACLGNVPLANGMFATMQRRQTFGLSWRTKTGNAADGEDGYKIHILYGATAIPATKSNETLGDTPQPVNFQWTITAVPQLPGMDLNDPNSDPNSWVWPEGYGMPGWPMGPDGNTPVPGWRGFPYVIIDSNDVDPIALENLETHLYGIDHTTPAYLPTLTDVTNILNGHDVPYDYGFDWTDPNPVEPVAGPRFYWQANDDVVQSYNLNTGKITTLTRYNPKIPDACKNYSIGAPIRLGNGNYLIRVNSSGATQLGFVVSPDLVPTGETLAHICSSYWYNAGYVAYEPDDSIYDTISGLNWSVETVEDYPWSLNGFDNKGRFIKGIGDTLQAGGDGDGFIGAQTGSSPYVSLSGRWLYRNGPDNNCVLRMNLDTGEWQAVLNELQDPSNVDTTTLASLFVGIDDTEGIVCINTQNPDATNYDGKRAWVQIRGVNDDPWKDPINGFSTPLEHMGRPLRQYDPYGPNGPDAGQSSTEITNNGRYLEVKNGKLYYASLHGDGITNSDGTTSGSTVSVYAMSLADGSIEKLFDVPYEYYNSDGNVVKNDNSMNYPNNGTNHGCLGLIFDDGTVPLANGNLNLMPPITIVAPDYTAHGWNVPQTLYGQSDEYTAITDGSDDSYIRNIYSKLDTTLPGGAGTQFTIPIVADGGEARQLDGMTIKFRVRANSDMGLTEIPLNFYLSESYRYEVDGGQIACDGVWHDVTITLTEAELIAQTANNGILQSLFDEMLAYGSHLVVFTSSAWADNIGAATPWNLWLDFSNIEVHSA